MIWSSYACMRDRSATATLLLAKWRKFAIQRVVAFATNQYFGARVPRNSWSLFVPDLSSCWRKHGEIRENSNLHFNCNYVIDAKPFTIHATFLGVLQLIRLATDWGELPLSQWIWKWNYLWIFSQVPDRGGRPTEQRPEPEIPSWIKDKNKGRGGSSQYQQSRGGQAQAAQGNRYQQQNDRSRQQNQGYHQNRGYHDRVNNQGYQQNQGHEQNQQNRGSYRRGGYQNSRGGRGGSWGGYNRGGGNQGGVYWDFV